MRSRGVTAKLILGTWFMSASCTARLPLCGFLIHVFGPIRREGHDHVSAGAGQGAVSGQVDVQVFTAQALPLGEVFEAAELFVVLVRKRVVAGQRGTVRVDIGGRCYV